MENNKKNRNLKICFLNKLQNRFKKRKGQGNIAQSFQLGKSIALIEINDFLKELSKTMVTDVSSVAWRKVIQHLTEGSQFL